MEKKLTRRSFFGFSLAGLAVIPFITKASKALAADACPTKAPAGKAIASPTEGMGKTFEYVLDTNTSKNALHKAGQSCANCNFYTAAKADSGYAPCVMMGNKFVTNCGWCKSYKAKAKA
jgi:hypothetical protein